METLYTKFVYLQITDSFWWQGVELIKISQKEALLVTVPDKKWKLWGDLFGQALMFGDLTTVTQYKTK